MDKYGTPEYKTFLMEGWGNLELNQHMNGRIENQYKLDGSINIYKHR